MITLFHFDSLHIILINIKKNHNTNSSTKVKCNNAEYPDTHGNYRESHIVQVKLHWIWKVNLF